VKKIVGHLWYLSEVNVGLAVFDEGLPGSEREKLADAIQRRFYVEGRRKCFIHVPSTIPEKEVLSPNPYRSLHFPLTLEEHITPTHSEKPVAVIVRLLQEVPWRIVLSSAVRKSSTLSSAPYLLL